MQVRIVISTKVLMKLWSSRPDEKTAGLKTLSEKWNHEVLKIPTAGIYTFEKLTR